MLQYGDDVLPIVVLMGEAVGVAPITMVEVFVGVNVGVGVSNNNLPVGVVQRHTLMVYCNISLRQKSPDIALEFLTMFCHRAQVSRAICP